MPRPIIETSQYDDPKTGTTYCPACTRWYWSDLEHRCDDKPRMAWKGPLVALTIMLITILMILGVLWIAFSPNAARAQEGAIHPVPIMRPLGLLQAKQQCPDSASLTECRAALRRALSAIAWQRGENLKLARQMVGNVDAWTCIHNGKGAAYGTGEGSWTARTGNGYYGGLQMDHGFMHTYGRDMIQRHHGGLADTWTPREQIIVAQRAFIQGRGYAPWPQTSRACGLR